TFENAARITAYDAEFYGQSLSTGTPGEYLNRTRAIVKTLTGTQAVTSLDTGVRSGNAGMPLASLGTAPVSLTTSPSSDVLNGTNFTIEFGDNGTFNFATVMGRAFNAATDTIDTIISAINAYGASLGTGRIVNASISNGILTLNNDPPDTVTDLSFVQQVKFVESQIKISFGTSNSDIVTLNNPSDETISSVLTKFNAKFPGVASFDWDSLDDRLVLDLSKVTSSTSYFNQYGKHIMLLVNSGATGQGDSETNGLDLGQFFRLNYVPANTYAAANGINDNTFGAADGVLVADGTQKITSTQDIDNGDDSNPNHRFEITGNIATNSAYSLNALSSATVVPGDNSIRFGTDPVSQGLIDFFNLVNKTDTGTGALQSTVSNTVISGLVSLNAGATQTIQQLLTAQVPSLAPISGPLVLDGTTLIANISTKTMNEIVAAIQGFTSGDRTYSASFNGTTGKITISLSDNETLAIPGSPFNPSPLGGVKKNLRELSNDTAAYTP
ncbi:MAG: hypothetical protein CVV27_02295, partial [Candidatus Melainabacteria bacterium HGW-Melainabacteria-1]